MLLRSGRIVGAVFFFSMDLVDVNRWMKNLFVWPKRIQFLVTIPICCLDTLQRPTPVYQAHLSRKNLKFRTIVFWSVLNTFCSSLHQCISPSTSPHPYLHNFEPTDRYPNQLISTLSPPKQVPTPTSESAPLCYVMMAPWSREPMSRMQVIR